MNIEQTKLDFTSKAQKILIFGILIGVVSFIASFIISPERAWINYLVNSNYLISLALGGGFIIALMSVTSSSFISPYRRIPESFLSFLPYGFILMIFLYFGIHTLYEWSHEHVVMHDAILKGKSIYLNPSFFMIRIAIFFTLWITVAKIFTKYLRKQDNDSSQQVVSKITKWSAIFMIVFCITFSLASFDWLMSLRPHWYSTVFAVYNFSGMVLNVFAVITFILIFLVKRGYFKGVVNENHIHDLGKFIFGFSTFWAYIWFCQYLLIWYTNMPEESIYYVIREHRTWQILFYLNIIINWGIPFLLLMTRKSKRNLNLLSNICIVLIVGRWIDLYIMVAPDVYDHAGAKIPMIGPLEIGIAIGFACLFLFIILKKLSKMNLVAICDPYLEEGIHLRQ